VARSLLSQYFPFLYSFEWTVWSVLATIADILILTFVFYKLLMLIRGTRAVQLIRGIIVIIIVVVLSDLLGLHTIGWILDKLWAGIIVALAVIFQPELRRALEQIGRGQFFSFGNVGKELAASDMLRVIDEITGALVACAKTKTGVLLVIERETGLNDYIETGIAVDALVTEQFLTNIFVKNTPLHDGAAIIRGDRVLAAACFLPLTDNPYISLDLGTRHRAAIGISEVSDALVLIVSEETGIISCSRDGKLVRYLDEKQLKELLIDIFSGRIASSRHFWQRKGAKK
jgi:diadenylate cyclase